MDPRTLMRGLEEQLRRVKHQYLQIIKTNIDSDVNSNELLNNAKLWFLRTLQNTDLIHEDITLNAVEYVSDELFAKKKIAPYNLMYPSIIWLISTMPKEQIDTIFGVVFYNRLKKELDSLFLERGGV